MGLALAAALFAAMPSQVLATSTDASSSGGDGAAPLAATNDASPDASVATGKLSDVIAKDADGNDAMYTTLRDADGKVIATNDPNREVDEKYKPTSEGGKGVGVEKGATIYVNFRMAEIVENDGSNGIQEGAVYAMDLPAELVPSPKSLDGKDLIDPETPISFFNSGNVKATGGIYTKVEPTTASKYELHIVFSDVVGRVDVSGEYQFETTLSGAVKGGSNLDITYAPGGKLSFKVADDPAPAPGASYSASVDGSRRGAVVYAITSTLTKTVKDESTAGDEFDYGTFTVKASDSNQGVWIDTSTWADSSSPNVFNSYGINKNYFAINYTDATGEHSITADSSMASVDADGYGVVALKDDETGAAFKVTFNGVLDGSQSSSTSYIATSYDVAIVDGGTKGLSNVQLTVPTVLTGDYTGSGSNDYQLSLTAKGNDAYGDLSATGKTTVGLGSFGSAGLSESGYDRYNLSSSLEYLPSSMATYLYTSTSGYFGNYYWTEFTPNINNSDLGENYYVSLASFLPNGALSSDAAGSFALSDGTKSTFMDGGAGPDFGLYGGRTAQTEWQYAGTVYVGELMNNSLADISCFSDSSVDAKLQYQLRQVFADANWSQQVVVYRSASKNDEGKYSYIVIDPRTASSAIEQHNRGWYNYCDGNGSSSSAKAGSWRLHIFNSPSTTLQATFPQYLGTFDVNDASSSGDFTDKVAVGNGSFDSTSAKSSTTASTASVTEQQATYMDPEWVSDDVIFWKMTINVANWQKWSDGYLYVKTESSLSLTTPPTGAKVSNQSIDGSGMCAYYQKSDGSWKMLDGSVDGKRNFTMATASDMNGNPTIGSNGSMYGYQISLPRDAGSTIDRASDNTITIGFFTKVGGSPSASNDTYETTAQLVCHTGDATLVAGNGGNAWPNDYGSYSYYGQWAYRASATGHAFMPRLSKSGSSTDTATVTNLEAEWSLGLTDLATGTNRNTQVNAGALFDTGKPYYSGGLSGRFSAGDTMNGSVVKDAAGNKVEGLDAGKYTHITQLFANPTPSISEAEGAGGCGPIPAQNAGGDSAWQKFVDGEWVNMTDGVYWDPNNAGIYRNTLPYQGGTYSGTNPMSIYVYYAGNMSDNVYDALGENALTNDKVGALVTNSNFKSNSLVVEYRGFVHGTKVSNITYKTQTDVQSLYGDANAATGKTSEIDALTQLYNVTLGNGAGFGAWKSSDTEPVSKEISNWITASLSIAKSSPGVKRDETTGGTTGSYTLSTQVGLTDAEYVNFQDYISGFSNVEVIDGEGASKEGTSYKEGDGDAAIKALVGSMNVKDLKIEVTEASGSKYTIYENGAFTGSDWEGSTLKFGEGSHAGALYCGQLKRADGSSVAAGTLFTFTYNLDLDVDGASNFRNSEYYDGGALKIANGAVAERPYGTAGDSITTSVDAASDDAAALLASGDVVEMGEQNLQMVDDGISLAGGEIDKDTKMLRVWPDADVEATYLAKDVLLKEAQKQGADSDVTSWMFWDWTGTQGKGSVDRTVHDAVAQSIDVSLLSEREDLTEAQKQEYLVKIDKLIGKYTTVANLKLYLADSKPADASSLSQDDLLWQIDGTISGDQSASKDGHQLSLKYLEPTAGLDEDGVNKVTGPGFDISATDLGLDKYLVSTYDMVFDRDAFLKEAISEGLLNDDGTFVGTTKTCAWSVTNSVSNGRGQNADASAGKVEVASSTISKEASGADASAGTASWTINANTGTVAGNGKLSISDKFTATADSEAVAAAAQKATSIDEVKVTYGGTLIWENSALTEAAGKAGWTAGNISVAANGSELSVELSNTDGFKPVADDKDIKVTYKTKLDKQAYVKALSDAGVTFEEGAPEYTLENAAALTVGSLKVSSSGKQTFTPDVPITASKTNEGHPGSDMATTRFVATAATGEVDRANFYLQDKVDAVEGTDEAQRAATLSALELSSFDVTVADSAGASQSFTAQDVLDGKVAGVSLTCANGDKLSLNAPGMADWKLTFAELQAGATVTVTYDVSVDRDTFLANGGTEEETVTLANALNAGCQDGNTAAASSKGEVSVQKQIAKSGVLSDKKAANGNPIINWTFDVYLESSFTADELAKLQSVAVRDQLNIALKADTSSVKVYDLKLAGGKLVQGDELPASEYEVAVDESNLLTVTLKNPQAHHNVRIVAPTELAASLDSVSNTAELVVDGNVINKDKVEEPGADAIAQWGSIVSAEVPTFTPYALKYVDGVQAGAEYQGAFTFKCVQINENGEEVEGGYSSQVTNDGEGVATFDKIVYQSKPREGAYYYRITEVAGEGSFAYDSTEYVVKVMVAKNQEDGKYLVSGVVTTPEDATTVRFDNSTKRSLTVSKQWDDSDNAAGKRPASVTVHLCQNGVALQGEDATVVLNEANGWSYTWKDLPIAGGTYSVVEDAVEGYDANVSDIWLGEDGTWYVSVTNTIQDEDHEREKPDSETPGSPNEEMGTSNAGSSSAAKTGDAANPLAFAALAGAMLAVAGFAYARSRKRARG